ncbi:hypothetical protein DASB73_014650 [Starmerella bacillaris]|uniref:Uncharacterized protein n=1 Tax=Starmerella bacillaris TaxID=1247836 RepID=A0AAV5RH18_STABA|nr:hypothetical protein DASB73_014650 [Starmerella bacillaris]
MSIKKVRRGCLPGTPKLKHAPENTIYISAKTPFAAAITKVSKLLARGRKQVVIVGLGRSMQQAMQVSAGLMDRKYKVSIHTSSMRAVDEIINVTSGDSKLEERRVPCVNICVTA